MSGNEQPFDIILFQVCSLAWTDLFAVGLEKHPIWSQFDVLFEQFNSATSYSTPAALRLLRSSCGQTKQERLFSPAASYCDLVANIKKLGFKAEIVLDHSGGFGDFLTDVSKFSEMANIPLMSPTGVKVVLNGFDNEPLYDDIGLLQRWLSEKEKAPASKTITYYNTIRLHDGNRSVGSDQPVPYKTEATALLDELSQFFTELQHSKRKVLFIFIPEHGRNLAGDPLQIPGLRDIPTPEITHIPVAIKFFGLPKSATESQLKIQERSSYLAISELIARTIRDKLFDQEQPQISTLIDHLPITESVSENESGTVLNYEGKYYIQLHGDNSWVVERSEKTP